MPDPPLASSSNLGFSCLNWLQLSTMEWTPFWRSILHGTSILLDFYEILEPRWYTVFLIFRVNNTLLVHCSEREVQHWVAKTWILDGSFSSFLHWWLAFLSTFVCTSWRNNCFITADSTPKRGRCYIILILILKLYETRRDFLWTHRCMKYVCSFRKDFNPLWLL